MEGCALETLRAAGLQAPKADLPSLPAWRRQDRPSAPTTPDEILGSQMFGRPESDAGQPRQEDRWRGRGEGPRPCPAARPGPDSDATAEGAARPTGLDPQTRQGGTTATQHSNDA